MTADATAIIWNDANRAHWDVDGYQLHAEIVPDDDADTSYLDQDGWEEAKAAFHVGRLDFVGVRVAVYREGVMLAEYSLWSIEHHGDANSFAYCADVAREIADEAMTEAATVLDRLCRSRRT